MVKSNFNELDKSYKIRVFLIFFIAITGKQLEAQEPDSLLWDSDLPIPKIGELVSIDSVEFYTIKKREKEIDQYNFLHGVALEWYQENLYASFAHNKEEENTGSEEARYCISSNMGESWSDISTIDSGKGKNLAISHGVLLASEDNLWAFQGCFYDRLEKVHMRAYLFDEKKEKWKQKGIVTRTGFWPLDKPVLMDNGNWIIGGIWVGETSNIHGPNTSAVAISHGNNLLKWDVVKIPKAKNVGKSWGESSNIVNGSNIFNISRYGKTKIALIAVSKDFGRTWSEQRESNLPMSTSKPFCGVLSTGHGYVINNIASGVENRHPLTIAIKQPNEAYFSQIYCIRDGVVSNNSVESSPNAALSYPYAIEHDDKLYVAYSNDGGRGKNLNSAELAVIPISELIKSPQEVNICDSQKIINMPDTLCYANNYNGHLQGIATDKKSYLYWSHTTEIVKTDYYGNIIKVIEVPTHHGDLEFYKEKIYVAVNFGMFNDENGRADSWVYVYDAKELKLIFRYPVPEVLFGAGGIAINDDKVMIVGGLPDNGKYNENYIYEYSMDFIINKIHKLKTGYTYKGIQTATYNNGYWYFGCYGKELKSLPPVVLKARLLNDTLTLIDVIQKDFSLGMVNLCNNKWLVSDRKMKFSACVINFYE